MLDYFLELEDTTDEIVYDGIMRTLVEHYPTVYPEMKALLSRYDSM